MADTESQNQFKIGLRYAGTSAATGATILAAFALITPDQAKDLVAQIHVFNDSVFTAYGALLKMWVILGPAAALALGYFGIKSGSVKGLISNLLTMAQAKASPGAAAAQAAIVNATGTIAQDKTLPASETAKQTLIAATIALPEVQTIVTDRATAEKAPSTSVVVGAGVPQFMATDEKIKLAQ